MISKEESKIDLTNEKLTKALDAKLVTKKDVSSAKKLGLGLSWIKRSFMISVDKDVIRESEPLWDQSQLSTDQWFSQTAYWTVKDI